MTLFHEKPTGFFNKNIYIIGDVMLDEYIFGEVKRISPESPVPVLSYQKQKLTLGGAANSAANIASLGANAYLSLVLGEDENANKLVQLTDKFYHSNIIKDSTRLTSIKTRFVATNQQVMRLDKENTHAIRDEIADLILVDLQKNIKHMELILLSDYAKGVLSDYLTKSVIKMAKTHNVKVIVDPKGNDWQKYAGSFCITPNISEAEQICKFTINDNNDAQRAMEHIHKNFNIENVVLTRSKDGMSIFDGTSTSHIKTEASEVVDVSGAGDTTIATLSLALAANNSLYDSAILANNAAAIVIKKQGTATLSSDELINKLRIKKENNNNRIYQNIDELSKKVASWKRRHLSVGFTNGCFDLLHAGHLHSFIEAKKHCDRLIVAVNSDASVKRLKGDSRPIHDMSTRLQLTSHIREVDAVICFDDDTPIKLIEALVPNLLIKGGDYKAEDIVGYDFVVNNGGKVMTVNLLEGFSTTSIIDKTNTGKPA